MKYGLALITNMFFNINTFAYLIRKTLVYGLIVICVMEVTLLCQDLIPRTQILFQRRNWQVVV